VQALAVLADQTRVTIVEALAGGEHCVGDLVERFDVSQPAISQHLKVLREAGLVSVRAEAQRRYYRLNPGPLRELDGWLGQFRGFWADQLDALERHLAAHPEAPQPKPGATAKPKRKGGRR
jgi:DNA-binding transcriptional ArsR family regulator